MGDRGQVKILMGEKNAPVFLYTHWGGTELLQNVQEALKTGKERWDDEEYLARIIFQHLIGDDKGLTGYGISTNMHGDIEHRIPELNCDKRTIKLLDKDGKDTGKSFTFEEFVRLDIKKFGRD